MFTQIRIFVDVGGALRKFAWLSLQPKDGALSVGFADRGFLVPALGSSLELDGQVHKQIVDLSTTHSGAALTNPHFTFHPPARVHLRAESESYLAEQLAVMDLQVVEAGRVPWILFISKRVDQLEVAKGERESSGRELIIKAPSPNCSIALSLDFVDGAGRRTELAGTLLNHVETWPCVTKNGMVTEWNLHIAADPTTARQSATFAWFQQS